MRSYRSPWKHARHRGSYITTSIAPRDRHRRTGGCPRYRTRSTAKMTRVTAMETSREPRQPTRFEKKMNMCRVVL